MTSPRPLLPLVLVPLLLTACPGDEAAGKGAARAPRGPRAVPVRVAEATRGAIQERREYVADTRPRAEVRLASKLAGRVREVAVDLGDLVEEGDLLVRLDDREYRQALHEARAALDTAEARVRRAEVDLAVAVRDRDRKKALLAREAVTRAEVDDLVSKAEGAQVALELARAERAQAAARLERARLSLQDTRVEAPFAGAVASRDVDPGALVNSGTALVRLAAVDSVVVRFAAPEADVARLAAGQPVEVAFDAVPGEPSTGRIERISPVVDSETRTIPVEAVLSADGRIKPGMFARVAALLAERDDALLVPARAVVRRQLDGEDVVTGVYVVREGVAAFTPVRLGLKSREQVEIVHGLAAGDRVVTAGHSELKDGDAVRVLGEGGR